MLYSEAGSTRDTRLSLHYEESCTVRQSSAQTSKLRGKVSSDNLLQYIDNFRIEHALRDDAQKGRKSLGQFFTPINVAQHMAQLVGPMPSAVRILDPGAGTGILSAAAVSHILSSRKNSVSEIEVVAYEVDPRVSKYLRYTLDMCAELCSRHGIAFTSTIHFTDFIAAATKNLYSSSKFELAILNPPYKRVKSRSKHWALLKRLGIPHSNFYAAFMMLAAILLKKGGRLVSISPRSFCNGPYFLPFRKAFLTEMAISDIHVYQSRNKAFGADEVLQENIILGASKSRRCVAVTVTSSDSPSDQDIAVQRLHPEELVSRSDRNFVMHLLKNGLEKQVSNIVGRLACTLDDLDVAVSTGRVVEFRARELLSVSDAAGSVPLLLPANAVNGFVRWPLEQQRKLGSIKANGLSEKLLVANACYVLVKRFSSKEQKRRLSAAVLDPAKLVYSKVGIENHLNYLHRNGSGLPMGLAKGLAAYLNSSLADQYFRVFSGHTQVNASDLKAMKYPDAATLLEFGKQIQDCFPPQEQLDRIIARGLGMDAEATVLTGKTNIEQALAILKAVGVPRAQQNDRSALTLLALVDIKPGDSWRQVTAPLRGITQMIEFFSDHYGITYAPNTRETVRRYTIHQFWQMGLVIHNPDEPNRPINSPKYCYQITSRFLDLVRFYGDPRWDERLALYLASEADRLTILQGRRRKMKMLPVTLPDGSQINLTAGGQNELVKQIVEEFCPRFAGGGEVLYLGDAGEKLSDAQVRRFQELDVVLDRHGKSPDVIVYIPAKNWLVLIEAVTSHGPIDQKRQNELRELFSTGGSGLIFVTAFETRQAMSKYLSEISWETEVWIAESPDHLIHFDGERFLGPY